MPILIDCQKSWLKSLGFARSKKPISMPAFSLPSPRSLCLLLCMSPYLQLCGGCHNVWGDGWRLCPVQLTGVLSGWKNPVLSSHVDTFYLNEVALPKDNNIIIRSFWTIPCLYSEHEAAASKQLAFLSMRSWSGSFALSRTSRAHQEDISSNPEYKSHR